MEQSPKQTTKKQQDQKSQEKYEKIKKM